MKVNIIDNKTMKPEYDLANIKNRPNDLTLLPWEIRGE
jgi:hypothetical protein